MRNILVLMVGPTFLPWEVGKYSLEVSPCKTIQGLFRVQTQDLRYCFNLQITCTIPPLATLGTQSFEYRPWHGGPYGRILNMDSSHKKGRARVSTLVCSPRGDTHARVGLLARA